MDSRSTYVHKMAAIFLLEIVSIYPRDFIRSLASTLKPFFKHCLQNQNGECRGMARKALLIWQQLDPASSERIFSGIDEAQRTAVLTDELGFAVHAIRANGNLEQRSHHAHCGEG